MHILVPLLILVAGWIMAVLLELCFLLKKNFDNCSKECHRTAKVDAQAHLRF